MHRSTLYNELTSTHQAFLLPWEKHLCNCSGCELNWTLSHGTTYLKEKPTEKLWLFTPGYMADIFLKNE